jgi:nucleoid DNA-binding protein
MTTSKKTITAKISEKTGLSHCKSKKALTSVLDCIKRALADGKAVDLGKLGKLKIATRKPVRRINKNLNGIATIENVYKNHPKTVRLLGGNDLSDDPKPTIVHKKRPDQQVLPARSRSFRVAVPSWHRRFR